MGGSFHIKQQSCKAITPQATTEIMHLLGQQGSSEFCNYNDLLIFSRNENSFFNTELLNIKNNIRNTYSKYNSIKYDDRERLWCFQFYVISNNFFEKLFFRFKFIISFFFETIVSSGVAILKDSTPFFTFTLVRWSFLTSITSILTQLLFFFDPDSIEYSRAWGALWYFLPFFVRWSWQKYFWL